MKSPFPGMDPYLEAYWGDIHNTFMTYAKKQLNQQLPEDLVARVENSLFVDAEEAYRTIYPDVAVVERSPTGVQSTGVLPEVAVAEPSLVLPDSERRPLRHLEIIDRRHGGKVVTVIELISPANKSGDGRTKYQRKQQEYLDSGINFVEVDLLRAGEPIVYRSAAVVSERRTAYVATIHRHDRTEVYCIGLRQILPNLAIPLRPNDRDVVLQLQPILDECYADGRYDGLNYADRLDPPLNPEDAAWAAELIRAARPVG